MKKKSLTVMLMVSVAVLMSGASQCKKPEVVELAIFHTNDLHSRYVADRVDPFHRGGYARVATLLKELRQAAPVNLTLDGGDYSEGTFYFYADAGVNSLKLMQQMGYDATVLGNHDFLTGPDLFVNSILSAGVSFPVLAANLDTSAYSGAAQLHKALLPSVIKNVGGIKVGLIGLTTYDITYSSYMEPVRILDAVQSANDLAKQMRPNVDVLIVISHNANPYNVAAAAQIYGIDAIVSGHSHVEMDKAILVKNMGRDVAVVEAGSHGSFLGDLRFSVDKTNKTVQFKSYQLRPITQDIAEDPTIAQMVSDQDKAINAKYKDDMSRVVAQADIDFLTKGEGETTLGAFAVKAYREASGADLALEELTLTGLGFPSGPVTVMDLRNVVPHIYNPATNKGWTLHRWNAKGSDLALVLHVFYTLSAAMPLGSPTGWLAADNVDIMWDPTRVGKTARGLPPIRAIWIGGKLLEGDARYNVAIADGMVLALTQVNAIAGLGLDLSDMKDTGIDVGDAMVTLATQKGTLSLSDFGLGKHVRSKFSDLALAYYGINWDGKTVTVEVENRGMQASTDGATLTCGAAMTNNPALPDQWDTLVPTTTIGTGRVGALASGVSTQLTMPWGGSVFSGPGVRVIRCEITGGGDTYFVNNVAVRTYALK